MKPEETCNTCGQCLPTKRSGTRWFCADHFPKAAGIRDLVLFTDWSKT